MAIVISGNGIDMGGNPVSNVTVNNNVDVVDKEYVDTGAGVAFVANDTRVKTALNASGNAPIHALRAYLNFNHETNVIRKSVNISSVADIGVGILRPSFIIPMETVYYPFVGIASDANAATDAGRLYATVYDAVPPTKNNFTIGVVHNSSTSAYYDSSTVMLMVTE